MNRSIEFVKNLFVLFFGTILPSSTNFIMLPLLTANLSKTEYGVYDLILVLQALMIPIITLQIQTAAFRYLIQYRGNKEEEDKVISNIFAFVTISLFCVLLILFVGIINKSRILAFLICIYLIVYTLECVLRQIVRGLSLNRLYSISTLVESITLMVLVIIFVMQKKCNLYGILLSYISAEILAILLLSIKSKVYKRIKCRYVNAKIIKQLLQYSWPMVPNALSLWILSSSDKMILTLVCGVETSAIYAIANKIPSILSVVQDPFTLAWQENASIAVKDDDVARYYSEMFDYIFSFLVGILAILTAAAPILFKLFVRGDYSTAYKQIPILLASSLFTCISSFFGGIYIAEKRTKEIGITTICCAIINIIIDLLLVKKVGIYAASISTLISYLFLTVYRMWDIKKYKSLSYKPGKILTALVSLCIMFILCAKEKMGLNIINFFLGGLIAVFTNWNLFKQVIGMRNRK